jgi:hypothetical protein
MCPGLGATAMLHQWCRANDAASVNRCFTASAQSMCIFGICLGVYPSLKLHVCLALSKALSMILNWHSKHDVLSLCSAPAEMQCLPTKATGGSATIHPRSSVAPGLHHAYMVAHVHKATKMWCVAVASPASPNPRLSSASSAPRVLVRLPSFLCRCGL